MEQDVSAYYDQTQNHYELWWHLDKGMSLHYGLWYPETRNFLEALHNTNEYMATKVNVKEGLDILDAGCGVGGAAVYLARNYSAKVTGLSLSSLQIETARINAEKTKTSPATRFVLSDFTSTNFNDESFDIIWACESSSSAPDKTKMLREWFRLLKPGGQLILLDFFATKKGSSNAKDGLAKWCELWAMSPLVTVESFTSCLEENRFELLAQENLTVNILPTINRMYRSYLLGFVPANLYNLIFGARKYSRNHYKSGLYQYNTYKNGFWEYYSFHARKPDLPHLNP